MSRRHLLLRRSVALLAVTTAAVKLPHAPLPPRTVVAGLRKHTGAVPGPTPTTAPRALPAPRAAQGGTEVTLVVGPVDYVRLGHDGRVAAVRTTTGRPPSGTDQVLLVRPDGSTLAATPQEVAQVRRASWAGAFAVDTWVRAVP